MGDGLDVQDDGTTGTNLPGAGPGSHATFSSDSVMRFLGRRMHGRFAGEVVSDYRHRPEGIRVKHRVDVNSVKVYNKEGSVLRVETTINNPRDFKVYRTVEGKPSGPRRWLYMRKGIADLHRRTVVSQKCNERYLQALSTLDTNQPIGKLVDPVCCPTTYHGHRVRALHPWAEPDLSLLTAINRGEFALNGFRNRDLVAQLFPGSPSPRKAAAKVTRFLRILRAHHLVQKVPHTHRYHLTSKGRAIVSAILQSQQVSLEQLNKVAA
jgi:hypothetical protein